VERRLNELGQAVPVHEKARAETAVADARQALKEEAPLERLRTLTSELQQIYHSLGAAGAQPQQPGETAGGDRDDDVIDAEFSTGEA
jgi:molecular chaperone DnaK